MLLVHRSQRAGSWSSQTHPRLAPSSYIHVWQGHPQIYWMAGSISCSGYQREQHCSWSYWPWSWHSWSLHPGVSSSCLGWSRSVFYTLTHRCHLLTQLSPAVFTWVNWERGSWEVVNMCHQLRSSEMNWSSSQHSLPSSWCLGTSHSLVGNLSQFP